MASNYKNYYVKVKVRVKVASQPEAAEDGRLESESSLKDSKAAGTFNFGDESETSSFPENPTPNPPAPIIGKICDGEYFLGVRLNNLLYGDQEFRKKIGLFLKSELTDDDKKTSIKTIRNYSDAAALDVVSSVYVTFVAKQDQQFYVAWGPRHRTYIVFDARLNLEHLARILYTTDFQIGPQTAIYGVEPDSIKIRRSRKTTVSL